MIGLCFAILVVAIIVIILASKYSGTLPEPAPQERPPPAGTTQSNVRRCGSNGQCGSNEYCLCPNGQMKNEWCPQEGKRCLPKSYYLHNKTKAEIEGDPNKGAEYVEKDPGSGWRDTAKQVAQPSAPSCSCHSSHTSYSAGWGKHKAGCFKPDRVGKIVATRRNVC